MACVPARGPASPQLVRVWPVGPALSRSPLDLAGIPEVGSAWPLPRDLLDPSASWKRRHASVGAPSVLHVTLTRWNRALRLGVLVAVAVVAAAIIVTLIWPTLAATMPVTTHAPNLRG